MLVVKLRTWKTVKKPFSLTGGAARPASALSSLRTNATPSLSLLCVSISLCLSLRLRLSVPVSLRLFLSLCVFFCPCLCLCLSLSALPLVSLLCVCLCLWHCVSLCLCVYLYLSTSLCLCLSLALHLYVSLCFCVCPSLCLSYTHTHHGMHTQQESQEQRPGAQKFQPSCSLWETDERRGRRKREDSARASGGVTLGKAGSGALTLAHRRFPRLESREGPQGPSVSK